MFNPNDCCFQWFSGSFLFPRLRSSVDSPTRSWVRSAAGNVAVDTETATSL